MKHLVVIPSNQDRNRYADGIHTEHRVMHLIAERMVQVAADWRDVRVRLIKGQPESRDASPLEGLFRQQAEALAWLNAQGATAADTAIVNLHSDSGKTWRHVLGIYGGPIGGPSYRLADAVSLSVEMVMQTRDRRMWDYSAYVFHQRSRPYPSALAELGSHEQPDDMQLLLTRQDDLASAVLAGARGFLSLPAEPELPLDPDAQYHAMFNVRPQLDSPIYRYWRACRAIGEVANLGPAIAEEEPGEPYGEPGCTVQRFTNAIVVYKPSEGGRCFRAQVVMEPARWKLTG